MTAREVCEEIQSHVTSDDPPHKARLLNLAAALVDTLDRPAPNMKIVRELTQRMAAVAAQANA